MTQLCGDRYPLRHHSAAPSRKHAYNAKRARRRKLARPSPQPPPHAAPSSSRSQIFQISMTQSRTIRSPHPLYSRLFDPPDTFRRFHPASAAIHSPPSQPTPFPFRTNPTWRGNIQTHVHKVHRRPRQQRWHRCAHRGERSRPIKETASSIGQALHCQQISPADCSKRPTRVGIHTVCLHKYLRDSRRATARRQHLFRAYFLRARPLGDSFGGFADSRAKFVKLLNS